ncbi:acyl-CoA dehydrogenase [Desulfotruncus alcoholivorax]|uniref:acyl-CoA dehydrogenase n=1 Tax=Desulfotruncus alcoholivorax TaxID=265477 RepID=UPI000426B771|nr:acyl-CoA dehydrogenase [Desulfotruncus alcoholivorax]
MAANFLMPTRDQKFILKEWLPLEQVLSYEAFSEAYSMDDVDMILEQAHKMCREIIAPTNEEGDKNPAHLVDGKVILPESFKEAYDFVQENGWGTSNLDTEGGALPELLLTAVNEFILGANPAFAPYVGATTGSAKLIQTFGNDWQKGLFLPKMMEGAWSGTMCLTEPNAGSDVGDITTKAFPTETPGVYKIKGTKCFITAGDHNLTENIIHLLLARIEGAAQGTKGISLFIVPKYRVDDNGNITGSNDVTCVGVEHKMGLKASATAMLSFGDNNDCLGYLVGDPPDENGKAQGMAQMFQMMNGARYETGLMALAVAAVAYHNAAQYARERIQGRPLTNPKSDRLQIIKHADVRRMLMNMKAHNEAVRAMIYKTGFMMDVQHHDPDEGKRKMAAAYVDVTTPLIKAYASDVVWPLTGEAIQVYGGYGFSEEYPVAQSARDCKIYSIWEGTNYIQALDLIGRKWTMKNGEVFKAWMKDLKQTIESFGDKPEFAKEYAILSEAYKAYRGIQQKTMEFYMQQKFDLLPLFATRILHCTAKLYCGTLIVDQAVLAAGKMSELGADHFDYAFYRGKVEAARYYVRNIVPEVMCTAGIIADADTSVLDAPEEAFNF